MPTQKIIKIKLKYFLYFLSKIFDWECVSPKIKGIKKNINIWFLVKITCCAKDTNISSEIKKILKEIFL